MYANADPMFATPELRWLGATAQDCDQVSITHRKSMSEKAKTMPYASSWERDWVMEADALVAHAGVSGVITMIAKNVTDVGGYRCLTRCRREVDFSDNNRTAVVSGADV